MKILCVCAAGSVRSVCLAGRLKGKGHDAIAAGVKFNGAQTIIMLAAWADTVVVMEPSLVDMLPKEISRKKVKVCDVGPDTYQKQPYTNPVLVEKVEAWLNEQGL